LRSDFLILQALMGQQQGSGPFVDPYLHATLLAQVQQAAALFPLQLYWVRVAFACSQCTGISTTVY
jgi:hypothetical protein